MSYEGITGTTTRDITPEECPWIGETIPKSTVVKEYLGHTYGCVSYVGVAVILPGTDYFTEIPLDAVEWEG